MYTLKPIEYTDADYATLVDIWNKRHSDEATNVEFEKYRESTRDKNDPYCLEFIKHGDEIVGYGRYSQNPTLAKANKYFLSMVIHPEHAHQQAVRQFYFDYACQQLKHMNLNAIVTWSREDKAEDLEFYENVGLKQVMRYPVSHLDVQAFDPSVFEARVKQTLNSGIEIITARQLQAEHPDNWVHIMYDLFVDIVRDIPNPDEIVAPPFDQYLKFRIEDPRFLPDAYFIARDGDHYVGESSVSKHTVDEKKFHTRLTGVRRSHRRRGIALALKVHAITFAKQYGVKALDTDNEENNPMYQINLQLGFVPQPAFLDFEKSLS